MRKDIYLNSSSWLFGTPAYNIDAIFNFIENSFLLDEDGVLFFNIEENNLIKILRLLYKYRIKSE